MDNVKTGRSAGLDIVRTIAVILVFLTHSLAYRIDFQADIFSIKWLVCVFAHFVSISCVPLFLLLSGYLCCNKKLCGKYFFGIIPVVISYLLIACVTAFLTNYGGLTAYGFTDGIRAVLNFTAIDYAWYVEMYIGLYLLIPFLNILYKGLETKKNKIIAIVVFLVLTSLVQLFQSIRLYGTTLDIIPDFWADLYPVTYYLIGAFIREYQPKVRKAKMLLFTFASTLLPFVPCVAASSKDAGYAWYVCNGFSCITTCGIAVCIFLLFYDVDLPKIPRAFFKEISVCSFEMYLWSYCVDLWLYSRYVYSMPLMILTVFGITYVLARFTRLGLYPINNLFKQMKGKA